MLDALSRQLHAAFAAPIASAKAKKPNSVVYAVDETPPFAILALNGVQHVGLIAINLVYPLLVFRSIDTPVHLIADLLGIGMLVLAVATILQSARLGPVGSGYMCPATFTATYFAPSLLAVKLGGLPLLAGMTIVAGLIETALAPLLNRLRAIFPPEVSGLIILMIGITVGISGMRLVFSPDSVPPTTAEWLVGSATLAIITGLNVWGSGAARMLCALIGLVGGYVLAAMFGLISAELMAAVMAAPWFGVPSLAVTSFSFDAALVFPFAIAAVAAAMKAAGTITVCQRSNDAGWVRPDMRSINRGVLADGLSTVAAGLAGTFGTNTSTPAVGLASATGVTSRSVAFAAAVIFALLGLLPKISAFLAVMPRAVIVPCLLFTVTFIIINGLQIITSRLFDARRTVLIGLSLVFGIAVEVLPAIPAMAPMSFQPVVGSSVVFATAIAIVLNLVFRIGVTRKATLNVEREAAQAQALEAFLEKQGAVWGARPDVVKRAVFGVAQLVDAILDGPWREGPLAIEASFDEYSFDVRLRYRGAQMTFPKVLPTQDEILADGGVQLLAGYMLRQNADRISSDMKDGLVSILFHYEH